MRIQGQSLTDDEMMTRTKMIGSKSSETRCDVIPVARNDVETRQIS